MAEASAADHQPLIKQQAHLKSIFLRYPFLPIFCSQIIIYLIPAYPALILLILLIIFAAIIKTITKSAAIIHIAILLLFFYQITGQKIEPTKWHYGSLVGTVKTFPSKKNGTYSFIIKSGKIDYWVRSPFQPYYSDAIKVTGRFVPLGQSCSFNPTFSDFLRSKAVSGLINADNIKIVKPGRLEFIDVFRNSLAKKFDRWLDSPQVASSLILGMPPPKVIYERFQRAGVSHILAVSGIHLGFFLIFFGFILNLLIHNIPCIYENFDTRRFIAVILLFASLFFIYLTGLRISAVRAFFMAAIYFAAIIIRRPFSGFNALFIAASLIGILMPSDFLSAGFILSVAGTAFAMILYKKLGKKIKPVRIVGFYILIFVFMLPLQLHFFGMVAPISPVSNLVIIPLVEIAIIPTLQIFALILSMFPHGLLILPLSNLINEMFKILSLFINIFDRFPYISIFKIGWITIGLFYLALFLIILKNLKYRYKMLLLTLVLIGFSVIIRISPALYVIGKKPYLVARKGKTVWITGNLKIYKIGGLLSSEGITRAIKQNSDRKLGPFYIIRQNGYTIAEYGKNRVKITKRIISAGDKNIRMGKAAFIRFFPYLHISVCR